MNKAHAYAVAVASAMRRPPRLSLARRKRCTSPPWDGRAVEAAERPDFAAIVAEADAVTIRRTPSVGPVSLGTAFQLAGL
jgi:hypothetical protein